MAVVAALLDTLPTPTTNGVSELYQQLKSILGTAVTLQAESSLQHRVEASVLPPAHPKDGGQRVAQGTFDAEMTSSPARFLACDCLSQPGARSEPQVYQWHHPGDDDAQSQQCMQNPCHRGHDDREGCSLSPEGPGPKAFGGIVHDAHFLRCFRAPGNIVKYDGKTNPSV
jgi:hypothetical protein